MVARRKLEDFPSPVGDGRPTRPIAPHSTQKLHYLWKYADTAGLATSRVFFGARVYADLYASCGVCETKKNHDLSWGSALAALQLTKPFDLYFLNDLDQEMTAALAARARALSIPGAAVFDLDTRAPDAFAQARQIANVMTPFGAKIVVATGDANVATRFLKELMRPLGKRRYLLAFIDPFSAGYHWNAFEELAIYERAMDVLALFPTAMDLGRNFTYYRNSPASGVKLDHYMGCEWRHIVDANPQHAEHDLRILYEQRMQNILGFKIGHPKGVGFNKRPLYHLIFGSKSESGMKLWNDVNRRDAFEQEELWLDGA